MDNQENNNMSELDQLKAQYETLKQQFEQQEIVNDRLIKSATQTDVDFFAKYRKTALIAYPILAVLGFAYYAFWGQWAFAIGFFLLLAVMIVVEMRLTRKTRRQVMENADLLTLSQNMQKLKTGYAIYTTLIILVGFLFVTAVTIEKIDSLQLHGPQFMDKIWSLGFAMVLMLVFAILAYRNFVGHCNNVIRQIDTIEGRPTSKKSYIYWYFLGGLILVIVGSMFLIYQLGKPTVYTRPENDTTSEGKMEIRVIDDSVSYFHISSGAGQPMVQTVTCSSRLFRKEDKPTAIIVYLTPQASVLWHIFTSDMKGHRAALFMDEEVVQEWYIQSAIENGCFFINADPSWSKDELEDFCNRLIKQ